ncbi:hypothetical protein VN97_g12767, partial [Penicillium thymicola]
ERGDYLVVDM